MIAAPPAPSVGLGLGVTGHREGNATFGRNRTRIADALDELFTLMAEAGSTGPGASPRLYTMLADGVDQLAADQALARGWELVAPLPFGRRLNIAVNAKASKPQDVRDLLAGRATGDVRAQARATAIGALCDRARVFELADRDDQLVQALLATLEAPDRPDLAQTFEAQVSSHVALAARVLVEQCDLLVAVWDGTRREVVGGVGHTIACALNHGCPVIWIDAANPQAWRLLQAPEALWTLAAPSEAGRAQVAAYSLARAKGVADDMEEAVANLSSEAWKPRSHPLSHAYRRVEAIFGRDRRPLRSLRQSYEAPDAIAEGSGAPLLAALRDLPGGDPELPGKIEARVLRRFAWADGISARLSDVYRGGMIVSFALSTAAILSGVVYLPFVSSDHKAQGAAVELALLIAILIITALGQHHRWHSRWFETRRLAEYLRHSAILLALGMARAPGRWPRGSDTAWPETYARQSLREVGLPQTAVTSAYLRATLQDLLAPHVSEQRAYHVAKAERLTRVHHNLDRVSEVAFPLAVLVVAAFLALYLAAWAGLVSHDLITGSANWFTLLGTALPAIGSAAAGIRYFGDFERFAAISEVTAEKLGSVETRLAILLEAPEGSLHYAAASELAHEADDIVVTEIERWQSVFAGKHITVPV